MRIPSTPGTPHTVLSRADDDAELLSGSEQKLYRSLVGKLLYLIKHLRPDIANTVRELSKHMDMSTKEHLKELYRVIYWVLHTETWGLYMNPIKDGKNQIWGLSDTSFADNKETRHSTRGYSIF